MGDSYFKECFKNDNPEMDGQLEEVLRDSLESIDESLDTHIVGEEIEPDKLLEEVKSNSFIADNNMKVLEDSKTKETQFQKDKKKTSIKRYQRNVVELNKSNISKGRPKGSYSKMYQERLQNQRNKVTEKKNIQESIGKPQSVWPESQSDQVATDKKDKTATTSIENHPSCNHSLAGNLANPHSNYSDFDLQPNENFHHLHQNDFEYGLNDTKSNELKTINKEWVNVSQTQLSMDHSIPANDFPRNGNMVLVKNSVGEEDTYAGQNTSNTQLDLTDVSSFHDKYLPPISFDVLTSVRSAPADVEMYHTRQLQHEVPYRPSSMTISRPQDVSAQLPHGRKNPTGYSSIYSRKPTYEPYKLSDYKRLTQNAGLSGGLGPDTNTEEFKQKMKKKARQKEYAENLRGKHGINKTQWKKKPVSLIQDKNPKIIEANDRRKKALQYAKAIPKPTVIKQQVLQMGTEVTQPEPRSLLDLLRQRHENEKKAIDAVRKDLETKLKVKTK